MILPTDIVSYIMPSLLALSILYFFYARGKLSGAGSYEEESKAKGMHFSALASMFIVVSIWLVVLVLSTISTL
jgi:hypothetical protein